MIAQHAPASSTWISTPRTSATRGSSSLQSLKRLKTVHLGGTLVTPEGMKKLQAAMPGLEIDLAHRSGASSRSSTNWRNGRPNEYRDVDRRDGPDAIDGPRGPASSIRPARPEDCATIANLVRELAVYEKLEQFAQATADDFRAPPVRPPPVRRGDHGRGRTASRSGFALAFPTFSTFRGQPGLYLEDIFVRPEHRGRGIGKALLATRGPAGPGPRAAAGWNGRCSTGTRRRSASTARPGGPADGRVDRLPDRRRRRSTGWPRWPRQDVTIRQRATEGSDCPGMSRYFQPHIARMAGYVPGEQPQGGGFIKLNTNENPYPPSPRVDEAIARRR